MKRFAIALSILMLEAVVALPAFGQEASDRFNPSGYIQGQFTTQFLTGDISDLVYTPTNTPIDSAYFGGGITGGGFLTHWVALQARVNFLSTNPFPDIPGSEILDSLTVVYTADVKFYILNLIVGHANGILQPYAIAGLGGLSIIGTFDPVNSFNSDNFFTFELGAGLDLMINNHFGLFGEFNWQYVDANTFLGVPISNPNNIAINIGATYRF